MRRAGINRVSLARSPRRSGVSGCNPRHDASRSGDAVQTFVPRGSTTSRSTSFWPLRVSSSGLGARLDRCGDLLPGHLSLYGLTVEQRTLSPGGSHAAPTAAADDSDYAEE